MNLIRKDIYNNLSGFGTGFSSRPSLFLSLAIFLSVSVSLCLMLD